MEMTKRVAIGVAAMFVITVGGVSAYASAHGPNSSSNTTAVTNPQLEQARQEFIDARNAIAAIEEKHSNDGEASTDPSMAAAAARFTAASERYCEIAPPKDPMC